MIGANMAFSRRVLARVSAFDEELGPGGLGFHDESLFSAQLMQAGFVISGEFAVMIEHHFDVSRLRHSAWIDRAVKGGRSDAYLDYHWHHKSVSFRESRIVRDLARLVRQQWRGRLRDGDEGCPEAEMVLVRRLAYLRHYWTKVKGPRNYTLHGLIKLNRNVIIQSHTPNPSPALV